MKSELEASLSRRNLVHRASQALVAVHAAGWAAQGLGAQEQAPPSMKLKKDFAPSERESSDPPSPAPPDGRVGFAVVGLGRLSLEQILPAFAECKHARLAAVVSGTPAKAKEVAKRYGLADRGVYTYQTFDRVRDNPDVDVVYVVVPNSMHLEYTAKAAQAGKHVLCEKPMAATAGEAEEMVSACRNAGRKLMIAYRMQYEPHHREVIRMVRAGELGALKAISADNGQAQGDPDQWRMKRAMAGGGALPDVGIYCLNAARSIVGEEPIEVLAHAHSAPGDPRFREVEEYLAFSLQFPGGVVASCVTSYGYHNSRRYRVNGADGWAELDPAFPYEGQRLKVTRKVNDRAEDTADRQMQHKNQFAQEMDHMALCVRQDQRPHTPGEEGLQEMRLMAAVYESAREGRRLTLPAIPGRDVFRGPAPEAHA